MSSRRYSLERKERGLWVEVESFDSWHDAARVCIKKSKEETTDYRVRDQRTEWTAGPVTCQTYLN